LSDLETFFVLRCIETLENNGDEKVQENERNDDHKADEIEICDW